MSRRRCFLHCRDKFPLHGLPKEDELKTRWLKFIFTTLPADYNPNLSLCSLHFTEDCFLNLAQFNAGYSKRLVLKDGAVPTLLGQNGHSGLRPVSNVVLWENKEATSEHSDGSETNLKLA